MHTPVSSSPSTFSPTHLLILYTLVRPGLSNMVGDGPHPYLILPHEDLPPPPLGWGRGLGRGGGGGLQDPVLKLVFVPWYVNNQIDLCPAYFNTPSTHTHTNNGSGTFNSVILVVVSIKVRQMFWLQIGLSFTRNYWYDLKYASLAPLFLFWHQCAIFNFQKCLKKVWG